ncbi:MAG: hypothetical protein KUG53_03840 [Pseudomonadales bacterium]|nr:hypothetical protein [Pseudomonadales bacterium]
MAVWFITGKLGSGKSLVAVSRAQEYISKGRIVATNVDLNLSKVCKRFNKTATVYRVPDKPTIKDLELLGTANKTYDEQKNGLLLLDECGTWFNSRSWNDKSRSDVLNWFLHARKLGWDIIFLVQDISIIDKQARVTLCEFLGTCTRFDRFKVPIVNMLVSPFIGRPVTFPKIHVCTVRAGQVANGIKVDRWVYRAKHVYQMYDTKQCFSDTYPHGTYQVLPPYYVNRNGQTEWNFKNIMRISKIHLKSWGKPALLASVAVIAIAGSYLGNKFGDDPVTVAVASQEVKKAEPEKVGNPGEGKSIVSGLFSGKEKELPPIQGEYDGFSIVGYVSVGRNYLYQFRNDKEILTVASNRKMPDRVVTAKGACNVVITSIEDYKDTVSITDPTCFNTFKSSDDKAIAILKFDKYCNDYGCIDTETSSERPAQRDAQNSGQGQKSGFSL